MGNVELLMQYVTYALVAVGGLAFTVSVIVQVIKELPWLMRIQTSVVVLTVSVLVCVFAMVAVCQYYRLVILWYYWLAAVIVAFFVYLIATGGWERVSDIWERTKYRKYNKK